MAVLLHIAVCLLVSSLSLVFCFGKKRKQSSESQKQVASVASQRQESVRTVQANQKTEEPLVKPENVSSRKEAPLLPEKTQMTTGRGKSETPLRTVDAPENVISDVEDDDTINDAPSLKPARPDLPSTKIVVNPKKQSQLAKRTVEMKEDVTAQSDKSVREVKVSGKGRRTPKKNRGDVVTAVEKKPSMVSKKNRNEARLQPTQD